MKISKSFITLLSVVLLSSVGVARGMSPIPFSDYDTNKNGIISEAEFDTAKTANMTAKAEEGRQMRNVGNSLMFNDIDTNKDGKVTAQELSTGQQMQRQKQQQNRNKNQKKSRNGQGRNAKN
jgi:Ca2+-binding EF-hand superfamily protein